MTQLQPLTEKEREALNEAYFSRLSPEHINQIDMTFLFKLPHTNWRLLMHDLYAIGCMDDMNRALRICDIFMYLQRFDWAEMYKHALAHDFQVRDAMQRHPSISLVVSRTDAVHCAVCCKFSCATLCWPCKHACMCHDCASTPAKRLTQCSWCGNVVHSIYSLAVASR
jgi:hypothetical protein